MDLGAGREVYIYMNDFICSSQDSALQITKTQFKLPQIQATGSFSSQVTLGYSSQDWRKSCSDRVWGERSGDSTISGLCPAPPPSLSSGVLAYLASWQEQQRLLIQTGPHSQCPDSDDPKMAGSRPPPHLIPLSRGTGNSEMVQLGTGAYGLWSK